MRVEVEIDDKLYKAIMEKEVKIGFASSFTDIFVDAIHKGKERKTGRWIHLLDGSGNVECTECGVEQPVDSYYCPFCGAKMEMRYLK